MATVRYLVHDVAVAADFYVGGLGFELVQSYGPAASAARPMPDGRQPSPGGWNRIVVETADIEALAATLKAAGVAIRNEIISGPGERQVLCEDPSGNAVELFQPA
jgi:catechol 2,3-dioxygenase-like lactoylglutathione lyase family enzyme